MQGVFITGTNTGVGKTYVGTLLARDLSRQKIRVIPRKPIESGCEILNGELVPRDATELKAAADYSGDLSEVCPYRFEPPISPVRAAHLANKVLTTEQLVKICLEGSENGFALIEGAGGFYSPLAEDGLNADLAVALQLPLLLIADDRLGSLNQVLLNVEAIQLRGLRLLGVVLNALDHSSDSGQMDNAADLREMLDCPVYSLRNTPSELASLPQQLIDDLLAQPHQRADVRLAV
jgi:dethiobiotin synthetase